MINLTQWLNENIGPVTLFVGSFVIFLYLKQKSDTKKDAARLIRQEVRFAEAQIRNFRSSKMYPLSSTILPTKSWHTNIHLFIKDLTESEIDLISTFYSQAAYIDILINKISDIACSQPTTTPQLQIPQLQQGIPQQIIAGPPHANTILEEVSEKIEFIFNSPAVEKLAKISKKRWYTLGLL